MSDSPQSRTTQPQSPAELLNDHTRVCVSISQAAQILGIAKSTAHTAYKKTGCLIDGVPVIRVGGSARLVVSLGALRTALAHMESAEAERAPF